MNSKKCPSLSSSSSFSSYSSKSSTSNSCKHQTIIDHNHHQHQYHQLHIDSTSVWTQPGSSSPTKSHHSPTSNRQQLFPTTLSLLVATLSLANSASSSTSRCRPSSFGKLKFILKLMAAFACGVYVALLLLSHTVYGYQSTGGVVHKVRIPKIH